MTRTRPFSRQGRGMRMAPFAGAMVVALLAAPLPPAAHDGYALSGAALLSAAIAGAAVFLPWQRLPDWAQAIPPLAYFGVVALMRESGGGEASGYGVLVLLPVLWLALYGTARELAASVAGVAAVFVLPILVSGAPHYPDSEWRRALLWLALTAMVGVTVQLLDRERSAASARAEEDARGIAAVLGATQALSRSTELDDARDAICEAALAVSGGDTAVLYEPSPDASALVAAAAHGAGAAELRSARIPFVGEASGATRAFVGARPVFVPDASRDEAVSERLVARTGARSLYFQPVLSEGRSVGVLGIVWRQANPEVGARTGPMMDLLAAEAAVAIERGALLQRLEAVARTDDLTGLANRRSWDEELPRELARSKRLEQPVCVAMIDLDRFKRFNDELGHQAGDRLLKEAAALWRSALRTTDTLARYGGEEFAVLLPACGPAEGLLLLERLRAATPGGQTCSAGVACWDGSESSDELMARADAALYAAKSAGRDRVVSATP